jgi:DNA-binding beta-propeller fold protein YncE
LYNECWTGLPNLTSICADDNEISALQSYLASCNINTNNITINSNCALANNGFIIENVKVFPNPFTDKITFDSTNYNDDVNKITIYNMLGSKVFSKKNLSNLELLDLSNLSKGVYIANFESDSKSIQIKIIKK